MIQEGVLRAIARLGAEALEIEKRTDIGKKEGYLSNPTTALAYFLRRLFYRGRADWLSDIYAEAAIHEVANFVEQNGWEALVSIEQDHDPIGLLKTSPRGYTFPRADIKMVCDSLRLVARLSEHNVVLHTKQCIETRETARLYEEIVRIRYVKDKLACLFLRDTASLFDLFETIDRDEIRYFLPVDTWVRQLCKRFGLVGDVSDNNSFKDAMIRTCGGVAPPASPIYFDHGLWVLSQMTYTVRNLELVRNNLESLRAIRDSRILETGS